MWAFFRDPEKKRWFFSLHLVKFSWLSWIHDIERFVLFVKEKYSFLGQILTKKLITFLATGFGSGLSTVRSRHVRHAGRCLDLPALSAHALDLSVYFLCSLCWYFPFMFADKAEKIYQKKDDQRIVIDEIIGLQITMLPVPINILNLCTAFCLFQNFLIFETVPC